MCSPPGWPAPRPESHGGTDGGPGCRRRLHRRCVRRRPHRKLIPLGPLRRFPPSRCPPSIVGRLKSPSVRRTLPCHPRRGNGERFRSTTGSLKDRIGGGIRTRWATPFRHGGGRGGGLSSRLPPKPGGRACSRTL